MEVYAGKQSPPQVLGLIAMLMPALLQGSHEQLVVLREQYASMTVESVEADGAGFFVTLVVPDGVPTTVPPEITGGDADIWIEGREHPMGVVLFVRDGRLWQIDFYSKAGVAWLADDVVERIENVTPLLP